jgi:1,2-diacylglycerol 3-beta-glucosyltransferase
MGLASYALIPVTLYLSLYVIYTFMLVVVSLTAKSRRGISTKPHTKFAAIIPAHNEELLLKKLLSSLKDQDYPLDFKKTYVIADNCNDNTAKIARENQSIVLERTDPELKGKGYAIKYAFENIPIDEFDAILIVDADSTVNPSVLKELDAAIQQGAKIIQCYNGVGNPDESWFTRLMDVSRTIGNMILEPAKEILGLSSHLQGNGMCFTREIIAKYGWNAFTVGEDWEYYARIVANGERVAFVRDARIYHQESRALKQATSQRMRWASGRMAIAYRYGVRLFIKGLSELNVRKIDASLALLFPNPSMAVNLTIILLLISIFGNSMVLVYLLVCMLMLQVGIFCIGIMYTDNKGYKFLSIFLAPVFLAWKMFIDVFSALGFGRKRWIRTERSDPVRNCISKFNINEDKVEKNLNIGFFVWTLKGMGGSERVVFDIARKMKEFYKTTNIISFYDGPVRMLYENIGVKVSIVEKRKKKLDVSFIKRLKNTIRNNKLDLINAHHFGPFFYTFLATLGTNTKIVYTEHSRWQLEQLSGLKKIINRLMLFRTDAVIAISNQIEQYYLEKLKLSPNKVHLIKIGIDLSLYQKKGVSNLRNDLPIGEDELVIGSIAHIRPEKNHKFLINAFQLVLKKFPNIRLILAGEDQMNGEMKCLAKQLGIEENVIFLGKRDDVPAILNIIDLFCLTSFHEGMPLTILEAMACGVPVIGTDVIGINELISHKSNGILVPIDNVEELADSIVSILKDSRLRGNLSKTGIRFIQENYSLDNKIIDYRKLFNGLCSIKGPFKSI